ncbi:CDP-glucose 4,6-dehydratase [Methylobacterium sp. 285MFTsu5.1]|uniref:CDP-glucose 4,6-dehydratase n=1 Tax=Methylobacterium sp. 285MFTsu5.1 TaxID=1172187 RepID=UPI0005BBE257|nr:CDP-glucose 4,6-dehydratase [Methylobacterium sp. 285MFTsu5.1]
MRSFDNRYAGARVVVTGHTGFKGAWLSLWLTQLGANVYGYSKDIPTDPSLFDLAKVDGLIDHTIGDIRDFDSFKGLLHRAKPDYVFHLAAQPIVSKSYSDPIETMSTNVMGTTLVLEALRSVDWPCVAVLITSDKCYDNVEWVWGYRETDALGGKDVYSGSKGAAELAIRCYLHSFFRDHPVRLGIGRAGNVIGGGDWAADRIVVDCIKAWLAHGSVPIRSPAATRPWQHVLEPLSGYLDLGAALARDATIHGEAFNFGPRAEQSRTVVELLGDLAAIWGFDSPDAAYKIIGQTPFHEASLLKLNCDKALLQLKWQPTLSYAECVDFTGNWYREVLREGQDARASTLAQIERYEQLATKQGHAWSRYS